MKRNLAEKFKEEETCEIRERDGTPRYDDDEWGVEFNTQDDALRALIRVTLSVGRDCGSFLRTREEMLLADDMEEQLFWAQFIGCGLHTIIT